MAISKVAAGETPPRVRIPSSPNYSPIGFMPSGLELRMKVMRTLATQGLRERAEAEALLF